MSKCMNDKCNNETNGRSKYCSASCKTLYNRNKSVTVTAVTVDETESVTLPKPDRFGLDDCDCQMCQSNRSKGNKKVINHGAWKPAHQLAANESNRVALPGDPDYNAPAGLRMFAIQKQG